MLRALGRRHPAQVSTAHGDSLNQGSDDGDGKQAGMVNQGPQGVAELTMRGGHSLVASSRWCSRRPTSIWV